jgi:hypothetical protein
MNHRRQSGCRRPTHCNGIENPNYQSEKIFCGTDGFIKSYLLAECVDGCDSRQQGSQ